MGCPCQGANNKQYVYVAPDGTRTVKATQPEAIAMKIRAGNVGEVQVIKG
jgi:hypothetical protein